MPFSKNPAKLIARAEGYEMRGKTAKAQKYRAKAARVTAGNPMALYNQGINPATGLPLMQQQPILMQQQPLMMQQGLPLQSGLQSGIPFQQQTTTIQQTGFQQGGIPLQSGLPLQQQGLGLQSGLPLQQQGLGLQSGLPLGQQGLGMQQGVGMVPWTQHTPARYEANALKWEKRGNYNKAQKNRGKVWRLQNPAFVEQQPPQLYRDTQFLGYNVPFTPAPIQQATQVETIVRPTIVEETMRAERIVEVQPIVHREIEQPQVKIIEKHLYETVPSQGPHTITNAPIVQETVRPHIIEEVQPVVHREVPAPFVERVEQHVTEHIVQPTTTTKQIINDGVQQPFVAAGGAPLVQQQTTTTTTTTQQPGLMGKIRNAI